jgi:hypothetical protein
MANGSAFRLLLRIRALHPHGLGSPQRAQGTAARISPVRFRSRPCRVVGLSHTARLVSLARGLRVDGAVDRGTLSFAMTGPHLEVKSDKALS